MSALFVVGVMSGSKCCASCSDNDDAMFTCGNLGGSILCGLSSTCSVSSLWLYDSPTPYMVSSLGLLKLKYSSGTADACQFVSV